jgi:hypothetical protein
MSEVIFDRWLWIIIILLITIGVIPFIIIWVILLLPSPYNMIATSLIIVFWGVAAGYKEWALFKRKEEESKKKK